MDNVSNSENAVSIDVRLRNIVRRYLDNEKIEMDSDLYELGLDSIATLGLILELEDELDLELPDAANTKSNSFSFVKFSIQFP